MDRNTALTFLNRQVLFGRMQGEKTLGTVLQVNSKTCTIRQDQVRGVQKVHSEGKKWKVPFALMFPTDGSSFQVQAEINTPVSDHVKINTPVSDIWLSMNREIITVLTGLYAGLSPENLYADGERSASEARTLRNKLEKKIQACFVLLDRTVSESECFEYHRNLSALKRL